MGLLGVAWRRVAAAATTLPPPRGWAGVGCALAASAATILPLGFATGLLHWRLVGEPALVAKGTLLSFLVPGVSEELLFRALLLPHPAVDGPMSAKAFAARAWLPLLAFVGYHLLNPRPRSRRAFWDWRFLAAAGLLGAACSAAYFVSGGSLLAAAVTHWLPVACWLFLLGGCDLLGYGDPAEAGAGVLGAGGAGFVRVAGREEGADK